MTGGGTGCYHIQSDLYHQRELFFYKDTEESSIKNFSNLSIYLSTGSFFFSANQINYNKSR